MGYLAEYITENGKEVTKSEIWKVTGMIEHESLLTAIVKALTAIREGNEITVNTESQWVVSSIEKWMAKWSRNGWINEKGEEVRNRKLFEKIAERRKTDIICARKGTGNKYGPWLQREVLKKEKEGKGCQNTQNIYSLTGR